MLLVFAALFAVLLTVLLLQARFSFYVGKHTVLRVRVLFWGFTLLDTSRPPPPKKPAPPEAKTKTRVPVKMVTKLALAAVRTLLFRARIRRFCVTVTTHGDADEAARAYGAWCALLGTVTGALESRPNTETVRVRVRPDFCGGESLDHLYLVCNVRPIDLVKELL